MHRIPNIIQNDLTEYHIKQVWEELHDRFGFDLKAWRRLFQDELSKQARNVSELDYFMVFGNRFINPILNDILCRPRLHPTFNKFVSFIMNR